MNVTRKLLSAFYRADREGLSFNEAYNVSVFRITTDQYRILKRAHIATFGCLGGRMTVKQAKFAIDNHWCEPC